jgi:catalase
MEDKIHLTNEVGAPIADNENTVTFGARGPAALQDVWLLEKHAHFNREVIPERRMHAKGWGAYGKFTVTHDITKYTKAKIFSKIGKQTDLFVRFSQVAGERGAADAERDIRGFACKFYTEEGNWDLVGNNTPVFFVRDAHNFPGLNRAVKRDPRTGMRSAQNNWDFWTCLPETFHQRTITMSDRGIPQSYRNMHVYGEHTYSFYNSKNERVWCKFHFRTEQGIKNLTDMESSELIAHDRESMGRDLFEAIETGDYPKWTMFVQIMTDEQARKHYENPFDVTKIWKHKEFPLIEVGVMELNQWPDNYYAEVEQAAFSPAHIIPGIGFSPDKLLQGRLFAYSDAQRYRLGVNYNSIPVNQAKHAHVADSHRDGTMRVDGNYGAATAYTPNSYGVWVADPAYDEPPLNIEGALWHFDFKDDPTDNCFRAGGDLYRLMNKMQQSALIANTMNNMKPCTVNLKYRHAAHCLLADEDYGGCMAEALELDINRVRELLKLSQADLIKATPPGKPEMMC